jgi:hypothetical protein
MRKKRGADCEIAKYCRDQNFHDLDRLWGTEFWLQCCGGAGNP